MPPVWQPPSRGPSPTTRTGSFVIYVFFFYISDTLTPRVLVTQKGRQFLKCKHIVQKKPTFLSPPFFPLPL